MGNGRDQIIHQKTQKNGRRMITWGEMGIHTDHTQCAKMSQLKMTGRNSTQKIGRKTIKNMDQSTNHKSMTQRNGKKMIINQAIGRKDIHIHTKVITMDHIRCTKMMENMNQNLVKIKKSIHQNTKQSIKHQNIGQKMTKLSQKIP